MAAVHATCRSSLEDCPMMFRILALSALAACSTSAAPAPAPPTQAPLASPPILEDLEGEAAARGRALALNACASCHAVGWSGSSPLAAAPPFRDVVRRRSIESLANSFSEGLVTDHGPMPAYTFRASEIDDLTAYLERLQEPGRRPAAAR
ncbi:MAG: c-type cytochrome [Brevundimonas sp.]|nr:MAG: c-type cytochrome [Brevundimonas sp.]